MYANARALIRALGGARIVSDKLGARLETVRMWIFRGKVPRSSWPDLMIAFPEVSLADLVGMEASQGGDVAIKPHVDNRSKQKVNGL